MMATPLTKMHTKQIKKVIQTLRKSLASIDAKSKIPTIVKSIDSVTQQAFRQLYLLREEELAKNKQSTAPSRKGHCC